MTITIILIGPMGVGKSTVGELLAEKLDSPYIGLDDLCWGYYDEIGLDHEHVKRIIESDEGFAGVLKYMKPFEAYAVERFVEEHPVGVLDFGAGHVVQRDSTLFGRVQAAFASQPNVVLLLPSADFAESIAILHERMLQRIEEIGEVYRWAIEENKHFITHPSNAKLAKITVYTKDKTPEQTCDEITQHLR